VPLQQLAKVRAFDKLFFETGVEEEDITAAFIKHKIGETEEFKQLMAESKKNFQQKV